MSSCYIYIYEIDGIVRYIGRGRRNRIMDHLRSVRKRSIRKSASETLRPHRFYDRLEQAIQSGSKIVGRKIFDGLTGDQAIALEMQEIGKYPPDELWNTIVASTPRVADADWRARQSAGAKRVMADPNRRRSISEKMKALNADPEVLLRKSLSMKETWSDPVHREERLKAQGKALREPTEKARRSAAMKAVWANPEFRSKRLASHREAMTKPDFRAKRSARQKANPTGFPAIGRAWWAAEGRLDLLRQLREAGHTYPQIAERLGTKASRVADIALRMGIKPLTAGRSAATR